MVSSESNGELNVPEPTMYQVKSESRLKRLEKMSKMGLKRKKTFTSHYSGMINDVKQGRGLRYQAIRDRIKYQQESDVLLHGKNRAMDKLVKASKMEDEVAYLRALADPNVFNSRKSKGAMFDKMQASKEIKIQHCDGEGSIL